MSRVLVTGGAGYVGSVLVPRLLEAGHAVTVLDLFLFGDHLPRGVADRLARIAGDIRDGRSCGRALPGHDVGHPPGVHLERPELRARSRARAAPSTSSASSRSWWRPRTAGVRRFIYASTSSVYGVSDAPEVTEEHPLVPLTDYNKYKGLCEPLLFKHQAPEFHHRDHPPRDRVRVLAAPAAGSHRQHPDHGGGGARPDHRLRGQPAAAQHPHRRRLRPLPSLLDLPAELIAGKTYNAGYQNHTVAEIAEIVRRVVAREVPGRERIEVVTTPSNDLRSYHISSEKIRRELGFVPKRTIEDAVRDLCRAFTDGQDPRADRRSLRYHNVKAIQAAGLR